MCRANISYCSVPFEQQSRDRTNGQLVSGLDSDTTTTVKTYINDLQVSLGSGLYFKITQKLGSFFSDIFFLSNQIHKSSGNVYNT